MSQPYIGEIRMFAGTYVPAGWLPCDGSLVSIGEHEMLFQLIGTTYGGDAESTFATPDLRGCAPIHHTSGFPPGATAAVAPSDSTHNTPASLAVNFIISPSGIWPVRT